MPSFLSSLEKSFKNIDLRRNIYSVLILRLLIILLLFSICRIGFYLFNVAYFPGMGFSKFLKMMVGGLKFDTSAILYTNLLFILLHLLPFPFRYNEQYQKVLKWLFFIFNGVVLAANVADFVYFKFTLKRTTSEVFKEFSNESNLMYLFLRFIIDYWYTFLFWIALVIGMIKLYKLVKIKKPKIHSYIVYIPFGIIMGVFFSLLTIAGLRGGVRHSTRPITLSNAGKYVQHPTEISIVLNTPFAIYRTLGKKILEPLDYFKSDTALELVYSPVHIPDTGRVFTSKNVLIIIMESFSTEFMGTFNEHLENGTYKGYTPFLDTLMKESKAFRYSFANGRKTIDALPSVLSGIPALQQHFVLSHYSGNQVNSIASHLKEKGYHTSFFHGAPNGSMGFESYVNLVGFDHYYGKKEYGNNADFDGIWGIWDEEFFQFYADKLEEIPSPFLSVFYSVTSHHPYIVPERHNGKFREGPLKIHKCIHYSDYSLEQFFRRIREMPWFDNTLFVITGDHASALTYLPEYMNQVGFFSVPIIFYEPGSDLQGFEYQFAQHIDIVPTILNFLNYDRPFIAFGQDLFSKRKEPFVINWRSNIIQIFMEEYILLSHQDESYGLYNFKNDRLLEDNLLGKLPDLQDRMELKRNAFIQQYNNRMMENRLTVETDSLRSIPK
jgi:phosphoglycerol transferase MdoB-like AlkP superfamily enzyme